jgi:uncharacterized OB-fold protein
MSATTNGTRRTFRVRDEQRDGEAVRCPSCGLVLAPRGLMLTPEHCPRCVARVGRLVQLEPIARHRAAGGSDPSE